MNRLITPLLIVTLLFFFNTVNAQQAIFKKIQENADKVAATKITKPFSKVVSDDLGRLLPNDKLKAKTILDISKTELTTLKKNQHEFLKIALQLNKEQVELQLFKTDLFSAAYQVAQSNGTSRENVSTDSGAHYWGIVKDKPNSLVAISIFDDEVAGMINTGTEKFTLGKIRASNYHILYRNADFNFENDFSCDARNSLVNEVNKQAEAQTQNQKSTAADNCIDIHIEADYELYLEFEASVTSTINYINTVMGQVAILYANEGINIQVSYINVWTNTSPYNAASADLNLMLDELFLQGWGQTYGTLVHLMTTVASGGIAELDALCDPQRNGAASCLFTQVSAVPVYSVDVLVVAHEIGHNIGSRHTHDCAWNGNNTPIDGCGFIYTNGADGCNGPIPAAGTIMSYCHLLNVGTDFSLGFGTQPGNLLRSKVNNANCLATCVEPVLPTCNDGISNGNEIGIDCGGTDCPDCPDEVCEYLNFNDYNLLSYDTQDNGTATILSGGTEIYLTGNAWKAIPFNLTLSPVTTISFEFKSTLQGEIHEIAFDTDLTLRRSQTLMFWGTQSNGGTLTNPTYNGSGNWQTFTVDIGAQFIGTYNYLIFTCDDDANATGNSFFRNVTIWEDYNKNGICDEATACAATNLDITFDDFPGQTTWDLVDANGNIVTDSNGSYGNQAGGSSVSLSTSCLPDGCYTFTMYDALGNGMCPFKSSAVGVSTFITPGTLVPPGTIVGTLTAVATPGRCGEYELTNAAGEVLVTGGNNFGMQESTTFCLSGGTLQKRASQKEEQIFKLYPTLATNEIHLSFGAIKDANVSVEIFDIIGKQIQSFKNISIADWSSYRINLDQYEKGAYILNVSIGDKKQYKKFIKQ